MNRDRMSLESPKVPEVSIIIPAHNRRDLLTRAIESVLQQDTESPFELIVIDDGSTESMANIEKRLALEGHRFITQEQSGPAVARNKGIEMSQAPWLAFLDSDDEWAPEKLAIQLDYHQKHPHFPISQTAENWIRGSRSVKQPFHYQTPAGDVFSLCLERCCVSCSSAMIHRSLLDVAGGFDPRYPVCEDYDLWIRIADRQGMGWISTPLTTKYAGHHDQLSKAIPLMDRFRLHALLKAWITLPHRRAQIRLTLAAKAQILVAGARKRDRPHTLYQRCHDFAASDTAHDGSRRQREDAEALLVELESAMNDPDWHCAGA